MVKTIITSIKIVKTVRTVRTKIVKNPPKNLRHRDLISPYMSYYGCTIDRKLLRDLCQEDVKQANIPLPESCINEHLLKYDLQENHFWDNSHMWNKNNTV